MWRNWPVVVIILAVIAIATAVVLMLWPPAKAANADSRKLPPPPAPERMDTNPLPPSDPGAGLTPPGGDPWSNRRGVPPVTPPPPDDPDDTQIDPSDVLKDPFANPGGGNFGGLGNSPFGNLGTSSLALGVIKRTCDRIKSCPGSSAASMCSMMEQSLGQLPLPPPPTCASAQRCLAQIDRLDVCGSNASGGGLSDVLALLATAQDCLDAAQHC
jgi:hypothetical protein